MTLTYDVLIKTAGFILSVSALVTLVWHVFKKLDVINSTKSEIDGIKKEQQMLCYGIIACLDGLLQLGANGNVTKALKELEKHINIKAHM